MVDDLLRNHIRPGMSRAQIRRLLGPPDQFSPPPPGRPGVTEIYDLGDYHDVRGETLGLVYTRGRLFSIERPSKRLWPPPRAAEARSGPPRRAP